MTEYEQLLVDAAWEFFNQAKTARYADTEADSLQLRTAAEKSFLERVDQLAVKRYVTYDL